MWQFRQENAGQHSVLCEITMDAFIASQVPDGFLE